MDVGTIPATITCPGCEREIGINDHAGGDEFGIALVGVHTECGATFAVEAGGRVRDVDESDIAGMAPELRSVFAGWIRNAG